MHFRTFLFTYICVWCTLSFHLNTGIPRAQASVGVENEGACRLARCQQRAVRGWLTCFVSKVGRGEFVTLIRVSSQKKRKNQGIFPVG